MNHLFLPITRPATQISHWSPVAPQEPPAWVPNLQEEALVSLATKARGKDQEGQSSQEECFGDQVQKKRKNTLRIFLIGGLCFTANNYKDEIF